MNLYWLSLVSLLGFTAFDIYLYYRQSQRQSILTIPKEAKMFEHIWKIEETEYLKTKKYSADKLRFKMFEMGFELAFAVGFIFLGGMRALWGWTTDTFTDDQTLYRIIFYGLISSVIGLVFNLPFEYYAQFVIEEKHGFNKSTLATFIKDTVIKFGLSQVVNIVLMYGLVKIIELGGSWMPLYATGFITFLIFFFMLIYPNVIAPLFNKFESLGINDNEKEKDLRKKVEDIAQKVKFPVSEIYKTDGSKRSAHSQAYFFGFFKKKRIVIYDTLIDQLDNHETESVLCHEIGHWYHSHNLMMLGLTLVSVQLIVWVLKMVVYDLSTYQNFGFDKVEYFIGITIALTVQGVISNLLKFVMTKLSRRNEFQADEFAITQGHGDNLIVALVKIYKENKADLDPDPLFSTFNHTHPTLLQRVANLKEKMAVSSKKN